MENPLLGKWKIAKGVYWEFEEERFCISFGSIVVRKPYTCRFFPNGLGYIRYPPDGFGSDAFCYVEPIGPGEYVLEDVDTGCRCRLVRQK
jgi:hypothetical protein